MSEELTLICPIRGQLESSSKSKDGLSDNEEYFRIKAIKHLIKIGYPAGHILIEPIIKKFGNKGRNSFRSDFAVLDQPVDKLETKDVDQILEHALLICEVKRDNAASDYVKNTQVKPMLDFSKLERCIGLYWDNVEQRVYWQEYESGKRKVFDGPLSFLPKFGSMVKTSPLTLNDTQPSDSLITVFERIEDILHQCSYDHEKRYEIILQLLLTKLFDEHSHAAHPDEAIDVQDFSVLGTPLSIMEKKFSQVMSRAISHYEKYLPNPVPKKTALKNETLLEILKILAPIRITHSKRSIIQEFYMKFAKDLYRWDMAQYFTPTLVTDYIVNVLNPRFGEHICDPACGSSDFLVAAFNIGREFNYSHADFVWGVDNSANAVQVSILNMVLNGDGKANIKKDDSLENVDIYEDFYDIMVCNPPFGTRIREKRKSVLKNFDLGHEWIQDENGIPYKSESIHKSQETGILFAEVCIRQCKPGGRIAIIVPNGYLGNSSQIYYAFRHWLLLNAKLVGICSLPRFTFKGSGADVSASVVFLEKREEPVINYTEDDYCFFVSMIEKLGWDAGKKKGKPMYRRNPHNGSLIVSGEGDFILDEDFTEALHSVRSSYCTNFFKWINDGYEIDVDSNSWTRPIGDVLSDPLLTMDPKRHCQKVCQLRESIKAGGEYLTLGDIVDFYPERRTSIGDAIHIDNSREYRYIQIDDIHQGDFSSNSMYGWELPGRARHFAEQGDIYFGSIWGSVTKWCYIGHPEDNYVVTNGCHRCRIKKSRQDNLLDLIAYMNTESWAIQIRSFTRGSDGLAAITIDDAKKVYVPLIKDEAVRKEINQYVKKLKGGRVTIKNCIETLVNHNQWEHVEPKRRSSHIALV